LATSASSSSSSSKCSNEEPYDNSIIKGLDLVPRHPKEGEDPFDFYQRIRLKEDRERFRKAAPY